VRNLEFGVNLKGCLIFEAGTEQNFLQSGHRKALAIR